MRIQKCKGTRDLKPQQMEQFRLIESVFKDSCLKWGYREVRTPTIEYLHLFTSTGTLTPGTLGRVYSFLDWDGWSGERVVLRPDGTIPVARMYIDDENQKAPVRYFYINNIFIFESTGQENRERWQCGTEMIGVSSPAADVELITIALETLHNLGIKNVKVKLSHAGIIRALLAGLNLSPEEQGKAFAQILDGDRDILARIKAEKPELAGILTPLLGMQGNNTGFLKNQQSLFAGKIPGLQPALENLTDISNILTATGIEYEIDIASGTGFEYYTGIIFQVSGDGIRLGGGGRYDDLIPLLGGPEIPASGFALYIDPIMEIIKQYASDEAVGVVVLLKQTDVMAAARAFELLKRLHAVGLKAGLQTSENIETGGWRIEVGEAYIINGPASKISQTAVTIDDLLKILGSKR